MTKRISFIGRIPKRRNKSDILNSLKPSSNATTISDGKYGGVEDKKLSERQTPSSSKENLSICSVDYKAHHYWILIGIWNKDYILYRCSQCLKSKLMEIRFLNGNYIEDYTFKNTRKNENNLLKLRRKYNLNYMNL